MHEYRRFVQRELDARGWKAADLVRASGASRQVVSKLLTDKRDYLGQMPDDSTIQKLARGFGIAEEVVRTAAARSLVGYTDDGSALTLNLQDVHIDALLSEIRRRVNVVEVAPESDASSSPVESQEAGNVVDLSWRETQLPPNAAADNVAANTGESEGRELRDQQTRDAEQPDSDGPDHGA